MNLCVTFWCGNMYRQHLLKLNKNHQLRAQVNLCVTLWYGNMYQLHLRLRVLKTACFLRLKCLCFTHLKHHHFTPWQLQWGMILPLTTAYQNICGCFWYSLLTVLKSNIIQHFYPSPFERTVIDKMVPSRICNLFDSTILLYLFVSVLLLFLYIFVEW